MRICSLVVHVVLLLATTYISTTIAYRSLSPVHGSRSCIGSRHPLQSQLISPHLGANLHDRTDVSSQQDSPIRVVLITGCSTGIGKSAAQAFLKDGRFKVWATMRSPSQSDLLTTCNQAERSRLEIGAMDVTSTESVNACIDEIIAKDGKIDVAINNAGYGLAGCLETVTLEEAQKVFDVNVWGVVRVLQAILPHMRQHRFGQIINLSSTSGVRGVPCMDYYTSSKYALEGLMDSMRYTMMPFGISVTNVNAGPAIQTSFASRCGNDAIGGKGTRSLKDESSEYLHAMVSRTISTMREKMVAPDAQSSDSVAEVLLGLVEKRLLLKNTDADLTSIPFNIGTNSVSQGLLQDIRKFPTGWGGIFTKLMESIPPLNNVLGDHQI